jgi:3-oxoacyl-[acyl-carrier protein] reductase
MSEHSQQDFHRLAPAAGSRLLVIGGCGGIGSALVQHAERLGLKVVIADLPQAAERRGLLRDERFLPMDLRDEDSINTAFLQLKKTGSRLDAVAICSGYTKGHDSIGGLDTRRFDDVLSGNLRGPVLAMRAMLPLLNDDASVVVLTTGIGQIGAPGYAGYGASKAGLNAIVRIFAAEVAPRVRVNGVAPGAVDTAFIRGGYAEGAAVSGEPERFSVDEYQKRVPMGRLAQSDDVVGPMLFLLSENARYITGQVLHVNGGAFMRD